MCNMWRLYLILCIGVVAVAGEPRVFPEGFMFGAASASYQVEGAWNHSDKGESTWDRLTHTRPEIVSDRSNGDVACDSFNQWRTDVKLAADLGLHFYRFSISWPRLLPTGFADKVSAEGSRYYDDLIDGLLENGVQPVISLYHWDLPQRLQDLGGWTNPLIADWFADYARVAFQQFGDRVKIWVTINEPVVVCDSSYSSGMLAPGIHDSEMAPHICAKNVLLAHAKAYRVYRNEFYDKYHGKLSISNHIVWFEPESDSAEDAALAELAMQLQAGRYSQPVFGEGGWPAAVEKLVAERSKKDGHPRSRLPSFTQEEIDLIKGTFDFYGLNHYTSRTVTAAPAQPWSKVLFWPMTDWNELPAKLGTRAEWPSGENRWLKPTAGCSILTIVQASNVGALAGSSNQFDTYVNDACTMVSMLHPPRAVPTARWMVYPEGLRKAMVWLKEQYGDVPILITENGYPTRAMGLEDLDRVDYYAKYLDAVLKAIKEDKVNVIGYTAWTLLDNFEWIDGYQTRFGLHEVDFTDPQRPRTPRRSAKFYADVIKHHSLDIPSHKEEL